ncbi:TetR/AcrR family transcriptional regulator [Amnibacterium kyonggiense]|uniref:TetR family transcriptional regulator n=1 Tax=Amnibacterium kyonggiense TaxID=595671 RepID=A0A4R7FJ10_9MICO|nr:TetR/AcrR family transcriptional regulator [Amnibacterium kyonggiense]TDS75792.1 TetR family transcriptional regulator [Amnibacterium kyonggiense]
MAKAPTTRDAVIPVLAEAFREHGYEGASMSLLQAASGLGRGSLYNFFPGGKEEMARAVLDEIGAWFQVHVFAPLRAAASEDRPAAAAAIMTMFDATDAYFRSGRRACLQGLFAIGRERTRFAAAVDGFFAHWVDALASALTAAGNPDARAAALETVAVVQGAIVLTRALDDETVFRLILHERRRALTT